MFDVRGCAAVVAAVIEQARRDANGPKNCPTLQRDRVQRDAQEFLVEVVQPAAAECLLDVVIPYRRQQRAATGSIRWAMTGDLAGSIRRATGRE